MGKRRYFLLFSSFALAFLIIHAQDQSGFVSLDCGLPEGSSYNESTTGISYTSDAPYIQTGISNRLPEFNSGMRQQVLEYLRSFPQGDRNCYMINLTKGEKYLIRTGFMYGNYDAKNEAPEFDLYLGPNLWATMVFQNASTAIFKEIIQVLQSNYLHVCLVNTGKGIPFISALELRLLKNTTYNTQSATEALEFFLRDDFGSTSNATFRFPQDVYDRIWQPYQRNDLGQISTSSLISSNSDYQPPLLAMRTASIPANASQPLNFSVQDSDSSAQFYLYVHVAEIEELQANQSREFIIYVNDKLWFQAYSPTYLRADTIQSLSAVKGGQFSMVRTRGSTLPPIINALEAYRVKELIQSQTVEKDGNALNGSVPTGLIDRSNRGLLQLNVEGNQIPCTWESCSKKKNSAVVPVVASVASVLSFLIIASALLWWFKRTKPSGKLDLGSRKPYQQKELKNRHLHSQMSKRSQIILRELLAKEDLEQFSTVA
ncbi:Malectin-like domain - like 10 [Theobroma cacao]|nr:Malectin-like domain - like 10 [Theobroma cacao]